MSANAAGAALAGYSSVVQTLRTILQAILRNVGPAIRVFITSVFGGLLGGPAGATAGAVGAASATVLFPGVITWGLTALLGFLNLYAYSPAIQNHLRNIRDYFMRRSNVDHKALPQ